jgi:hypothetical protein
VRGPVHEEPHPASISPLIDVSDAAGISGSTGNRPQALMPKLVVDY